MQSILEDVARRLEAGQFRNEEALKQMVVMRLLQALGWDVYDPTIVKPEFSINGSRVDYALCHPSDSPQLFVEVKQAATFETGEDQLLMRYAFQHGVPVAVLTDGQRWSFYLPAGRGTFQERRFYHLDLLEREPAEAEERLRRYLSFDEVKSGRAFDSASSDLDNATRSRAVASAMPQAWSDMLSEADARLCLALTEKIESLTGYRAHEEEIAAFLKRQAQDAPRVVAPTSTVRKPASPARVETPVAPEPAVGINPSDTARRPRTASWFSINGGERISDKNAINTTVAALKAVAAQIPRFYELFEQRALARQQGQSRTAKRRWIARQRKDLYDRQDLCEFAVELAPGWWLGTNYQNQIKQEMLSVASDISHGHNIQLDFYIP